MQNINLFLRTLKPSDITVSIYKTGVWSLFENGTLICSIMSKLGRISIESIWKRFTKEAMGWSTTLSLEDSCSTLSLEPFWLGRLESSLAFLHNQTNRQTFLTDPPVFSASLYPLYHSSVTIHRGNTKYFLRSQIFLAIYSNL